MTKHDLQQIAEEIVWAAREGREVTKGYTYPKYQHETPHNEMVDWVVEKLSACFCDANSSVNTRQ